MACLCVIRTHGLLAHGTLVGVSWRLVVVWVWNEAGTHAKDREWFNLQVSRSTTHHKHNLTVTTTLS